MAEPEWDVIAVEPHGYINDGYSFSVVVRQGEERESFSVVASETSAATAGFCVDGLNVEWVAARFRSDYRVAALDNYKPILPQLRRWIVRLDGDRDVILLQP